MSNYILEPQTILLRLALALFIGLLIGIDRDESWQPQNSITRSRFTFIKPGKHAVGLGGVRTYSILAILGYLLGMLYFVNAAMLPIVIVGFLGIIAYICISYFLNFFDRHTLGLTTEIGLILLLSLTFALGANLLDSRLILGIAVLISLISNLKVEFKKLIGSFTKKEILESIEFVAITAVILPWLPNVGITLNNFLSLFNLNGGTYGSIMLINPYLIWMVVVFISALNFVGYFLAKIFQSSSSILVTAFLGGLVSSTSVTQFYASRSHVTKTAGGNKLLIAGIIIANMSSFVRIPLIALTLKPDIFFMVIPTFITMIIASLVIALFLRRDSKDKEAVPQVFSSPLALKPALTFALLFLIVSIATNFGILAFGNTGFVVTALLASFSGLDAVTVVTSQAYPLLITLRVAAAVILGAVMTNLVFKLSIIGIYAEKKFKIMAFIWLGLITLLGILFLLKAMFL